MKNWVLFLALSLALMGVACSKGELTLSEDSGKKKEGSGGASFAQTLPNFSLLDPVGKTFTREGLSKNGLVLVVTAPTFRNKGVQEEWNRHLSKTKLDSKARWAYVEDMQASFFKEQAMSAMKKNYVPGKEPILLLDTDGNLRRALGVSEKKTVVLVYNGDGKLIHSETGIPSSDAAESIWKK